MIQRRASPFNVSFNRGLNEYQLGSGNLSNEFWLGNDNIDRLTAAGLGELRIDLTSSGPHSGFVKYSGFQVATGADKYRWSTNWLSGDIGKSTGNKKCAWNQTGMAFSTSDQDNDLFKGGNCAKQRKSGWWFAYCGYADLNIFGNPRWKSWPHVVVKSEMKLR